ncbi:PHD-finger [Teladorsagia circumcincta]|uniref:PHD-finger n=1 Tax=Teladorsagia circumcincta TaxID=45464 RepID=A0A2G9UJI7_TELCI|nr:PHD-finger [Teladorsagia circumcincta]
MHSRMVVQTEPSVMRTSYEQPVDPFMKRMAVVEKATSGPTPAPQRMIRHVPMPVELHGGEMYSDSVMKDDEQVMYSDQGVRYGAHSVDRFHPSRAPTRPYRFDFENNEDEERAIAEAIAREEELMRQEEADKGGRPEPGARDPAGRPYDEDPEEHARMVPSHFGMGYYPQPAIPRYTSNLAVHRDDSPDTRAVKQKAGVRVLAEAIRFARNFLLGASRGSSNVKNADASRPVPVAINPAEISLGGDSVDWTKDSESSTVVKEEGDNKDEDQGESNLVKDEQDIVEESNAVADWQPSRRGPALPPTPKYKKKMYERSLEDSSSSGSEVRRRGRPPKRHQRDIEEHSIDDKPAPLGSNPNALHCICRTTYNPRRFYVACEMCFRWFHGDCVGVTEENAKEMDGWTCRDCIQETKRARQEQELYCTCRTPYNDNE